MERETNQHLRDEKKSMKSELGLFGCDIDRLGMELPRSHAESERLDQVLREAQYTTQLNDSAPPSENLFCVILRAQLVNQKDHQGESQWRFPSRSDTAPFAQQQAPQQRALFAQGIKPPLLASSSPSPHPL